MNSPTDTAPAWRSFEDIPPGPEAASAAASCSFSLATLEVASLPGSGAFALVERTQPEVWRWALIGPLGYLLEEGFEPSPYGAKRAAEQAIRLARTLSEAMAT
jgi:hypothetical protein